VNIEDLVNGAKTRAARLEVIQERASDRLHASDLAIARSKRVIEDTLRRLEEFRAAH
jgi:hypothetical protein